MVCFYAATGVGGVDVEGIEVSADLFDWGKILFQQREWSVAELHWREHVDRG